MSLQLSFAEASAIGPREENQDALRLVTPAPALAASKGYLFAIADGVSQCADGGLAARSTLQALALDYYSTPQTWGVAQALDRLLADMGSPGMVYAATRKSVDLWAEHLAERGVRTHALHHALPFG